MRGAAQYEQREHTTSSLDDHIKLIKRQIARSMADPDVRNLAAQITSGRFDWMRDPRTGQEVPVVMFKGRHFRAPIGPLCRPKDDSCEIGAVWDFCVMNVRYLLDPEGADGEPTDMYMDVTTILMSGAGDCDDFVVLFATLLMCLGFRVIARVISTDGRRWAHIYPVVMVPKGEGRKEIALDATENGKSPGWEYMRGNPPAKRDFVL